MQIHAHYLHIATQDNLDIYNITDQIQGLIDQYPISAGHVIVFSCHTTTALAINEDEARLRVDLKTYLRKLAPTEDRYLHNDLHLREVPEDEPINAHAHLMAMTLSTSEIIPVSAGRLMLGTYQSVLFLELDGPRQRRVLVQITGQ
jgi:secondary thiamine-phosphate synthase enzyme